MRILGLACDARFVSQPQQFGFGVNSVQDATKAKGSGTTPGSSSPAGFGRKQSSSIGFDRPAMGVNSGCYDYEPRTTHVDSCSWRPSKAEGSFAMSGLCSSTVLAWEGNTR